MLKSMLLFLSLAIFQCSLLAQTDTYEYEKLKGSKASPSNIINDAESNPQDFAANYNAAVFYYNEGVDLIENMEDADQDVIQAAQEDIMNQFRNARVFALAAHEANPEHVATLNMLAGIHFGLNEMEVYDHYQSLIVTLKETK